MGIGLNDDIDVGLVNDNPNTPMGVDPTKVQPQELTQVKLPSELKMGKLDKIISISDPELEYKPPTKEELFGQEIVPNQLPDVKVKVQVKDELTKLNDLKYGQSLLHERGTVSQEDIQALDNVYKGSLINDDNLLGFYTKHASKTQYTQTLKQVNDLINKKVFILNENYQKYLQTLKESAASFKDAFAANARTIKGYISLILTEDSAVIKPLLQNPEMGHLQAILTSYINEFDIEQECHNQQIVDNYKNVKEALNTEAKFFKAFIDLHYKKDITVINSSDIRSKLYHNDTRYSILDIVEFITNQLPFLEPVVQRTIDKSIINIDTILNNYLNTASTANEKMDIISKNQSTIDEIEQELFVFEQIVKDTVLMCKNVSLLITAIDSETQNSSKEHVAAEGFLDSLKHGIVRMVSDEDKITQSIQKLISKVASKREKTKDIKEPGWGSTFNTASKSVIGFSDVNKLVQELDKVLKGSEYNKAIDESIDIYKKITSALEKHVFSTNHNLISEITDNIEKANDIAEHAISYVHVAKTSSNDVDYKPLTTDEAQHLSESILSLMDNDPLENRLKAFNNILDAYSSAIKKADESKFYQESPEHIKATKVVVKKMEPVLEIIFKIFKLRKDYVYAAQEYIRSSFS